MDMNIHLVMIRLPKAQQDRNLQFFGFDPAELCVLTCLDLACIVLVTGIDGLSDFVIARRGLRA